MAVAKDKTKNTGKQGRKHDEGYKGILSNKEVFLHFLKKYFAMLWTADISADDLELVNKSFITKEYRNTDSDLIYKLKIGGSEVYFYVLLELQSKVDFTMPFRLLRYMVELLSEIFKNTDKNVRSRKDFRLPAIVPIVLYNGSGEWTPAMSYREYTEGYGVFGENIINFRYLLFDLNRMDDEAVEPVENPLDAIFIVEKLRIRKKLTSEKFHGWWAEKTSGFSNDDYDKLVDWVDHIYFRGNMPPETREVIQNNPKKGDTDMKAVIDVWADEWKRKGKREGKREGIREGMSEGIRKGIREGIREGKKQGVLEVARNLQTIGMGVDDIAKATGLSVDEVLRL